MPKLIKFEELLLLINDFILRKEDCIFNYICINYNLKRFLYV